MSDEITFSVNKIKYNMTYNGVTNKYIIKMPDNSTKYLTDQEYQSFLSNIGHPFFRRGAKS